MSLQTVQNAVRNWLLSTVRIDQIGFDIPEILDSDVLGLPTNCLWELPPQDLVVTGSEQDGFTGEVTLRYSITYRFNGSIPDFQLPVNRYAQLLQSLMVRAKMQRIHRSIRELDITAEEYAVQVLREETEQADWFIRLNFGFFLEFDIKQLPEDPEFLDEGTTPVQLEQVDVNIYRAKINFRGSNNQFPTDSSLDSNISIP